MERRFRGERRLRSKDVAALPPGTHEDGGGLRLVVEASGARRWVQRVTIGGRRYSRGLGPYPVAILVRITATWVLGRSRSRTT